MGAVERRTELFENIARLRRAGSELPGNRDIAAVRAALERELGETVSVRLAARLLGVSHSALRRWITAGDVPTVYSRAGRDEVPVAALFDLREAVERERARGRRHVLEPGIAEGRSRARNLRTDELMADVGDGDGGHRRAERRALAYHRALRPRLRRSTIDAARHRLWQWQAEGKIDPRYAERWEEVLSRPVAEVRKMIGEDSEDGRDLRQNSPFAGMLSEAERRAILEHVR
jgi:hypothetical protein